MELFLFLLAIGLIYYIADARKRIEELTRNLGKVEREVFDLKHGRCQPRPPSPDRPQVAPPAPVTPQGSAPAQAIAPTQVIPPPIRAAAVTGPPSEPASTPPRARTWSTPRSAAPAVNWEQILGVKGFAWLGGFALFLGVAFFIKYSFDNNLISPQLRVAIGFLTGLGLLVGGVMMSGKKFPTLSQTLCATGIVVLYGHVRVPPIYHFEFFGQIQRSCSWPSSRPRRFCSQHGSMPGSCHPRDSVDFSRLLLSMARTIRLACSATSPFSTSD
jgi:uncharacterized membrane protein